MRMDVETVNAKTRKVMRWAMTVKTTTPGGFLAIMRRAINATSTRIVIQLHLATAIRMEMAPSTTSAATATTAETTATTRASLSGPFSLNFAMRWTTIATGRWMTKRPTCLGIWTKMATDLGTRTATM